MKTMELRVAVNGQPRKWTIAPGDLLLDVLRREGFFGVKRGCEKGECGSCTVLVDGRMVNSCLMFAAKCRAARF
jgi:putative selenate reductase molybdopterin-binding subunit